MKQVERILWIVIVLSALLRFSSGGIGINLLMISCTLLSIMYYSLSFALFNNVRLRKIFKKSSYKGISASRIIASIGLGMALSAVVIGIMFKFIGLPGSQEMLIIGCTFLTAVFIIALMVLMFKHRTSVPFYTSAFLRIVPVLIAGIFFYFLPLSKIHQVYGIEDKPEYELAH